MSSRPTASALVGLSHRGSRVETHAAAAMRQPYSVFAVVEKENGAESIHYVLKDHLGSWTTITDANGNIVREQSFDAWGNMRDPDTWTGTVTQQPMFDRGFTGHEHLNSFGLINMNGRMYDPVMSSFLSVDNYVQAPDFSQSFNRYAYCLNNPLRYVDPDGEWFWLIPNVGYSKDGGLSFGLTFAVGLPGLCSAQASLGYSVGSQSIYGSIGVSYAGFTGYVSAGYSFKNEQAFASIGITAGLSPYSGVPVSTNFLTVGASCDLTYSKAAGYDVSFTGNLSAWSYNTSAKAWNFNPSVSAMVYPEHTTNLVRGQGFRSNDAVLKRFVAANNHQGALDYFGFEGRYTPGGKHGNDAWYGTETGIHYSDGAFTSYDDLYCSYTKESFEQLRHRTNTWAEPSNPTGIFELDRWLAEYEGHLYLYKNQGLYPNTTTDLSLTLDNCINEMIRINSWFDVPVYGAVPSFKKEWWHFVYRIHRLY
jgi:RHS repeat-associated protein